LGDETGVLVNTADAAQASKEAGPCRTRSVMLFCARGAGPAGSGGSLKA